MMRPNMLQSHLERSLGIRHGLTNPITFVSFFLTLIGILGLFFGNHFFPGVEYVGLISLCFACLAGMVTLLFVAFDLIHLSGTHRSMVTIDEGECTEVVPLSRWPLGRSTLEKKKAVVFCFTPDRPIILTITRERRDAWGAVSDKMRLTIVFQIRHSATDRLDEGAVRKIIMWLAKAFEEVQWWTKRDGLNCLREPPVYVAITHTHHEILIPRPKPSVDDATK